MGYNGVMIVFKKDHKKNLIDDSIYEHLVLCFLTDTFEEEDKPKWYIEISKDVFTEFFGREFKTDKWISRSNLCIRL